MSADLRNEELYRAIASAHRRQLLAVLVGYVIGVLIALGLIFVAGMITEKMHERARKIDRIIEVQNGSR